MLESCGAQVFFEDLSKTRYYFFYNEERVIFDIEKNFWYVWKNFFWFLKINKSFDLKEYQKHKMMFDTLRYIFEFRYKKESFFLNNFELLLKEDFYIHALENNPFRKKILDIKALNKFLRQDIYTVFRYLKFNFFVLYVFYKFYFHIKVIFKRLFSNNTYAILWYDGSWKSTISKILADSFWGKVFYMGFRRYADRKYYKILDGNNILKLLRLLFVCVDFWLLYIQIFYAKIRYEFVFFDRHPKCEIYPHSGTAQKAIFVLFYFYPSPKKNFILYSTPEIIRSRKKERSTQEIDALNSYILDILSKNKRNIIIKNDTIDDTLNLILWELY